MNYVSCDILKKLKYTPAVRSIFYRNSSLQAVCDISDRAYHGLCVLNNDMGRRLRLQQQCSYQEARG